MTCKHILAIFSLLSFPVAALSAKDIVTDTLGTVKAVAKTPAELLKGEVSGVRISSIDGNPNGELNVNVRGLNTLRGDSQPLWIVDGAVIGNSVNQNLNAFFLSGGYNSAGIALPDYSERSYISPLGNFGWLNPYEIESIEIVKDMSAASRYGITGANGVIIVRTRKSVYGERNIRWSSNVGVSFRPKVGEAFRSGIFHSHDLGISGVVGNNSRYNISGFVRQDVGAVRGSDSVNGGFAVGFETEANNIFHFGLNSFLAYGNSNSAGGTNWIGAPSTMTVSRYPDSFPKDSVNGWLDDYEDNAVNYRSVNSVWLKINFLRGFWFKATGGMDYQNQNRYLWYGDGTSFGTNFSGAAGILNNSLFSYNATGELCFERNFALRHHFEASLAADFNGYTNRTNSMCGTEFDLPYLKALGLSSSASIHAIRKFTRNYNDLGGYARLAYDFAGYAGVDATVRLDRNSRFDGGPEVYPGVDAYFNFGKLFLKKGQAVSSLRIDGGYGWAGRETVLPYEYLSSYISNVPSIDAETEWYFDGLNRLLSKEYNIGFGIGFMEDRFNLKFRFYDKKTEDDFKVYNFGKEISGLWTESGESQIFQERMSSLRNMGVEIDADLQVMKTRNIEWRLYGYANWNKNTVLSLDALDADGAGVSRGVYTAANIEGRPIGCAWGYRLDGEGNRLSDTAEDLGNTLPRLYGSAGTTVRVFGLTLDAKISAVGGFSIINANKVFEAWKNDISSAYLERGEYVRLENLSASYDIPLKLRWIKGFRVNLAARNLLTFTKYGGWNPDVNSFGVRVRSNGVDYGSFPLCRSLVLGLNVKF